MDFFVRYSPRCREYCSLIVSSVSGEKAHRSPRCFMVKVLLKLVQEESEQSAQAVPRTNYSLSISGHKSKKKEQPYPLDTILNKHKYLTVPTVTFRHILDPV